MECKAPYGAMESMEWPSYEGLFMEWRLRMEPFNQWNAPRMRGRSYLWNGGSEWSHFNQWIAPRMRGVIAWFVFWSMDLFSNPCSIFFSLSLSVCLYSDCDCVCVCLCVFRILDGRRKLGEEEVGMELEWLRMEPLEQWISPRMRGLIYEWIGSVWSH